MTRDRLSSHSARVSLLDVAAAAGVSKSTASRALLGQSSVSASARDHVLATAARLGYFKDSRAHALKSGRSRTVAIFVRAVNLSFYGALIDVIQDALEEQGFQLAITTTGSGATRPVDTVMGLRPEGVIVASGRVSLSEFESQSYVPVVVVGPRSDSSALSSISDDGAGVDALAALVVECGHKNVGVLTVDAARSATLGARTLEMVAAIRSRGLEPVVVPVTGPEDRPNSELLRSATKSVTAILCPNDPIMIHVWEELYRWGIRVPDDISLTGYDGLGTLASPVLGLTTWTQPIVEMGRAAALEVVKRIADRDAPAIHLDFRGELVRGRTLAKVTSKETK